MEKMRTSIAIILTLLNTISLTAILYLSFKKKSVENDLTYAIIVTIASYFFDVLLLSSFCLTENECCELCCPANKCCLYLQYDKKEGNEAQANNDKQSGSSCKCCDVFKDCCLRPIGSCTRKMGKHGVRYCNLIILSIAHIGISLLCFYTVKQKKVEMAGDTIGIVIICIVMAIINLAGMIAPCFGCCERLRYFSSPKKGDSENKIKEENNDTNNTQKEDVIEVNDSVKDPLIQKDAIPDINSNNTSIVDNSNNNKNNNDNKETKDDNNFSNVFGIKRDESNNN